VRLTLENGLNEGLAAIFVRREEGLKTYIIRGEREKTEEAGGEESASYGAKAVQSSNKESQ